MQQTDTRNDTEARSTKYQTRRSITRIMHYATYYTLPEKKQPINQSINQPKIKEVERLQRRPNALAHHHTKAST